MFSSVVGLSSRRIVRQTWQLVSARRSLSTPSTASRRTWKGAAVRWSLAAAAIYYYNTSSVFAEENEDEVAINQFSYSIAPHVADSTPSTIDAIVQEKRKRQALQLTEERESRKADADAEAELTATRESRAGSASENMEAHSDLDSDEVDASQAGAFNPETGEINWDCPCLGGMAHGPCGENFKAAFSCFVYSKEEPKGVDCIEKFKDMQDCFRQHPDLYGAELDDPDDMPPDKSTDDGPDKSVNAEALGAEPPLAPHDNAPSAPLPHLATESPVAANPNPSPNSNPSLASLSDPPSEPHDATRSSG